MKYMITGGNRGLGQVMSQKFNAYSVSRSTGHDITQHWHNIAEESLDYDVFVNNAFDGPFQESWANWGQVRVLQAVAARWQARGKAGIIINVGSVGTETVVAPEPGFETYRVAKAALKHHSLQWSQAFKQNLVPFRTTLLTLDRLDTPLSRSRATWTGNGLDCDQVADWVRHVATGPTNTCVSEIIAWVNFQHQS